MTELDEVIVHCANCGKPLGEFLDETNRNAIETARHRFPEAAAAGEPFAPVCDRCYATMSAERPDLFPRIDN